MGKEPDTLRAVLDAEMTLWVFCLSCSHAGLVDPRFLLEKVKDGNDSLATLANSFRCTHCSRNDIRLIPTNRTMVSFDKMGLQRK